MGKVLPADDRLGTAERRSSGGRAVPLPCRRNVGTLAQRLLAFLRCPGAAVRIRNRHSQGYGVRGLLLVSGYHGIRKRSNPPDQGGRADVQSPSTGQNTSGSYGGTEKAGGSRVVPYKDAPEPGEKKATARETSGSNPQVNAKKEQKQRTAQKQSRDVKERRQRIKKSTRGVRGIHRDQKQLRTAANTARKEKQARQAAQRTQRMIYRAQHAARESAEAAKKVIAVIRSAI